MEERQLRTLKQMLRGLPIYAPSDDFENRLVANVARKTEHRQIFKLKLGFDWRLAAGFAATAALAMLVVVRVTERHVPRSEPTTQDGYAEEIRRDQMFAAGNDPLNGSRFAVPTSYEQR